MVHVDRRTVLTASAFGAAAPMAGPLVFGAMFTRTGFTDFHPFWEFVSGPIHGSTFLPKPMDATFGPKVLFSKGGDSESPRRGNQFFGQLLIDRHGLMTVKLRDIGGAVLWERDLEPDRA